MSTSHQNDHRKCRQQCPSCLGCQILHSERVNLLLWRSILNKLSLVRRKRDEKKHIKYHSARLKPQVLHLKWQKMKTFEFANSVDPDEVPCLDLFCMPSCWDCFGIVLITSLFLGPCLSIKYSRLSLSRLRLSRITAYLEVKFWSLF